MALACGNSSGTIWGGGKGLLTDISTPAAAMCTDDDGRRRLVSCGEVAVVVMIAVCVAPMVVFVMVMAIMEESNHNASIIWAAP